MSSLQKEGEDQQPTSTSAVGWRGKLEDRFQQIKHNAETYPYVWASYILVYGGLGLRLGYTWRKLRKTEDRVRALHKRLHELVEAQNSYSIAASSTIGKPQTSASVLKKPPTAALSIEKHPTSASLGEISPLASDKPSK